MSTQIQDQINNSELTTEDKEDFIFFLKNISTEELEQMTEMFNNNSSEIVPFWITLKEKLIFMELLDENTDFSDEEKNNIKQQISEMGAEEFSIFLDTIGEMTDDANVEEKMNSLLKQSKEINDELSSSTKNLISE
ncbi:MAG: hypothetical protein ACKUBY_01610 [Candidatus Moraniibacteriota bacterium]|jgi:hypothetical protein